MIPINPIALQGSWDEGWALDLHSTSSALVGYDEYGNEVFDTKRTQVGEALYKLKYKRDRTVLEPIAETIVSFILSKQINKKVSALVIVPPTNTKRPFQPNIEIAKLVGEKLNIPVYPHYLIKAKDMNELKGIFDPAKRQEILKDAYKTKDLSLKGKNILLFDDLYRSGSTLEAIAHLLLDNVRVASLYVVTVTKTRSLR